MTDIAAIGGLLIGIVALILAWVALVRAVPSVQWEPDGGLDSFDVWNAGPRDAVIVDAVAWSADVDSWPAGDAPPEVVTLAETLGGWKQADCAGTVLRQAHRHSVEVGTNCHLVIRYRAAGFLGRLSRAEVRIEGDV